MKSLLLLIATASTALAQSVPALRYQTPTQVTEGHIVRSNNVWHVTVAERFHTSPPRPLRLDVSTDARSWTTVIPSSREGVTRFYVITNAPMMLFRLQP
jgi:hypothetical protein